MFYDLRDDMLECFCGNSKYIHYYNPNKKTIIYYPYDNIIKKNKKCNFFHNKNSCSNLCINKNCNFEHIKYEELPYFNNKINKYIINENVYNIHVDKNKKLGWNNSKSFDERDERRINNELPNYIIEEYKDIQIFNNIKKLNCFEKYNSFSPNFNKSNIKKRKYIETNSSIAPKYNNINYEEIIQQPILKVDNEWFENRSRNIKINNLGIIYYVNKKTGEKSWIHPYTGKTNLPGGKLTPSESGL